VEKHYPEVIKTEAETVVQRQLDAFNARDIGALLAVYADNAELFEHPAKLLARGAAELRQRFVPRFQEANLRAVLLKRIVAGPVVVDHEMVTRTFPEGAGEIEMVMIYEVKDGRIAKAWSIAGTKKIFSTLTN
jgi:hypothetical protein